MDATIKTVTITRIQFVMNEYILRLTLDDRNNLRYILPEDSKILLERMGSIRAVYVDDDYDRVDFYFDTEEHYTKILMLL